MPLMINIYIIVCCRVLKRESFDCVCAAHWKYNVDFTTQQWLTEDSVYDQSYRKYYFSIISARLSLSQCVNHKNSLNWNVSWRRKTTTVLSLIDQTSVIYIHRYYLFKRKASWHYSCETINTSAPRIQISQSLIPSKKKEKEENPPHPTAFPTTWKSISSPGYTASVKKKGR